MPCKIKELIPGINCNLCKTGSNCPDLTIRNELIDRQNEEIEAKRPKPKPQNYGGHRLSQRQRRDLKESATLSGNIVGS